MVNKLLIPVVLLSLLSGCSNDASMLESNPALMDQNQFLTANAAKEGVVVTESGLQYEVLRDAEGPKPAATSTITVHYLGVLTDGTEFDSSYSRGEPSTFMLSGTIPGWVEGIQLMSVGSMYRFTMPADLAYGDRGAGTLIGPNEDLIFIVDLLEINSN